MVYRLQRKGYKHKDFAKHLAAFANQYGGWLLIGIRESSDGARTAGEFKGIPKSELEKLSLQIREASSAHISPPVLYEEHIIEGPNDELGLPEGHIILIVGIPQGVNPPYIHSSGRIYRRLADQSAPKEETDRYILDDLWRRGKENREKITNFLTKTPELSKAQENNSWAFVYITPDLNLPGPSRELTFENFRSLAVNFNAGPTELNIPMQSIYPGQGGFIARQVEKNDPGLANLSFRWWHEGIVRFEIPINSTIINDFHVLSGKHKYAHDFLTLLNKQGFTNNLVCDFSLLIMCVSALSNIYCHIRKELNDTRDLFATYELRNVFYKIPFIDSGEYMNRCKANGVPVIQDKVIMHSNKPYFDNMIPVTFPTLDEYTQKASFTEPYLIAGAIALWIFNSIGFLSDPQQLISDIEAWGIDKVSTAKKTKSSEL